MRFTVTGTTQSGQVRDADLKRLFWDDFPHDDPQGVKECNSRQGLREGATSSAMIAEDAPVFRPCQGVLHACATLAVASPVLIAEDSVALEGPA